MREPFESITSNSGLARILSTLGSEGTNHVLTEISEVWKAIPNEFASSLRGRLSGSGHLYRGALWEMYVWSQFSQKTRITSFEANIGDNRKSVDFLVEDDNGPIFYVEATTIGSTEVDIKKMEDRDLIVLGLDGLQMNATVVQIEIEKETEITPDVKALKHNIESGLHTTPDPYEDFSTWHDSMSDWILRIRIQKAEDPLVTCLPWVYVTPKFTPSDFVEQIRNALKLKLPKVREFDGLPVVLAICNSSIGVTPSVFSHFSSLYARPAVQLSLEDDSTNLVFTDAGFWIHDPISVKNVSGILFAHGLVPGFNSLIPMEMWLNPRARIELDISKIPFELDFYRLHEDRLECLQKGISSTWTPRSIF